ncbi:MAG: acyl-ACP--UDP-N-acetylglucosamine O-acyltransferase [Verrucomicrobia bacterium]|nr:acyl-ACP--UDP-N-acetylglucosamine O-acyltransferase [Verrucomicrobiota bacterium]
MTQIHPTAVIAEGAQIGEGVEIGAYSVVGPEVKIGDGTRIMPHAFLDGDTTVGRGCTVFPFASVGSQTQDLKFKGGKPGVIIGDRTTIREYVTVNAATYDGDYTRVGSSCHIMAYAHIAHDCIVGDEVIMANCGTLGGHVVVEDRVILGGLSGVHQFVRLGRMSIVGGCSKVTQDLPPYMLADGHPLVVRGLNREGLKRRNIELTAQNLLKKAFKIIYKENLSIKDALAKMKQEVDSCPEIDHLIEFIESSERGITR